MKNMTLAVMLAAAPAAAQTTPRASVSGMNSIAGLGASFDGARLDSTPILLPNVAVLNPLAPTPGIPVELLRPISASPASAASSNEFSQAPAWFDASQLKFDALVKSGTGGTAVLRYGWRSQYEMSVFAFPGSPSISFKEYSSNPMGHPKQSFDATLETAAARKAAAKILRAAQARNPVTGADKVALDEILAFLQGA
mgnify:FL=1